MKKSRAIFSVFFILIFFMFFIFVAKILYNKVVILNAPNTQEKIKNEIAINSIKTFKYYYEKKLQQCLINEINLSLKDIKSEDMDDKFVKCWNDLKNKKILTKCSKNIYDKNCKKIFTCLKKQDKKYDPIDTCIHKNFDQIVKDSQKQTEQKMKTFIDTLNKNHTITTSTKQNVDVSYLNLNISLLPNSLEFEISNDNRYWEAKVAISTNIQIYEPNAQASPSSKFSDFTKLTIRKLIVGKSGKNIEYTTMRIQTDMYTKTR